MSWEKDNQIPPSWSLEWVGIGEEGGHRHITEMCVSKYVMTDYSRCYEAATGDSRQCLVQKQEKTVLRGGEEHSRRRRGSDSICKGPVAEKLVCPGSHNENRVADSCDHRGEIQQRVLKRQGRQITFGFYPASHGKSSERFRQGRKGGS